VSRRSLACLSGRQVSRQTAKYKNTYRIFKVQKFFDSLLSVNVMNAVLQELKLLSVRVDDGWDIF
jgi:hypothetical protein